MDLNEPQNFHKGERLKIMLRPGGARQVLVRLLPVGTSANEPVDIIGNAPVPVENDTVIVSIDNDYSKIGQISVHGGVQAWDFRLGSNNGPAAIIFIERIK